MKNKWLKKCLIVNWQLMIAAMLPAQTIEVNLPSCSSLPYSLCVMQGTQQDTISTGSISEQGKAVIVLSGQYASYRGVGKLSIRECKSINMVLNGEAGIVVNELKDYKDYNIEVDFAQSPENRFVNETTARQRQLVEKYQFVEAGLNEFRQMTDPFYAGLIQERESLEKAYATLQTEISESPLYAARLVEILNCLTGTGSSLRTSQEAVRIEQQKFISEALNFEDLYTSSFWQMMMDLWYEINSVDDTLLLESSRKMLDRVSDIPIRRELTQSIIRQFSKYGKDYLLVELGTEYLTMPLNGQLAPEIQAGDTTFLPKKSLIMFYETGCGNCHYELEALKKKYSLLIDNDVRVISIAADTDRAVFEYTASSLPWADKFCDFRGFDGVNFANYGIVGTPTFILTDHEGIVRGRYARLSEWLKD